MSGIEIAFGSVALMLVLIYAGMHVAIALITLSVLGVYLMRGNFNLAIDMLVLATRDTIADYMFGVVPLFVLMGFVVSVSGMGRDTFTVAERIFRKVSGGLGYATVAANAVFATITGVSIASAAVFTRVAVPEMLRHGYTSKFAVGVVAGSSVLGMLLPPSLLFIVYGVLTEQSVGALFIAGILPGIVLAITYCGGIWLMAKLRPAFILAKPNARVESEAIGFWMGARMLLPIALLVVIVLGGIYMGFFTPTEAGAAGALGALALALLRRSLTWKDFWRILVQTGHITSAICFLIIGASLYSRMLALSGMPTWLGRSVIDAGFGPQGVIICLLLVIILLGTILDSISIMLLTLPIAVPILVGMDVDMIWLGVLTILAVEIGILTPPFGIAVYVIKSTLGKDSKIGLGEIFAGAFPFAVMLFFVLVLVFLFPAIATILV